MGWFQRLLGADSQDGQSRGDRSPNQARVSAEELAEELRALKSEITLLRETIGGEGSTAVRGSTGEGSSSTRRRRSRGGRGGRRHDGDETITRQGDSGRPRREDETPRRRKPRPVPDDAPTGLLVDYLKGQGILVYEGQDDLNGNEAFEHLARHLGTHFNVLANFYEKVKRCVATGRGQRIDIDGFTPAERSAAVQFGTLLHRHGMLKDFYYHRSPKKQLRVIPTKDGQVGQFLTGGWLEIYVSSMLSRRLRAAVNPAKYQLLYNVKGALPDGREFEADVMAAVDGRLFWLECKTGHWQDYSARFRGLVPIFGVDRTSGALLLIKSPDGPTRKRATDMLNMSLLALDDVDAFISQFLGISPSEARQQDREAGDDHAASGAGMHDHDDVLPLGMIPALSDEEIPLEDAAPARKLGRVPLDDNGNPVAEEAEAAPRRRRRRRRGGRGRGGRSAAAADAETPKEEATETGGPRAAKGALNEPVPMSPLEDGAHEAKAEDDSAEAKSTPAGQDAEASEEGAPRRRRRRRRTSSPFSENEGTEESASSEGKAEASAGEAPAEAKPVPTQAKSSVSPDLAAMMAPTPGAAKEEEAPAKPKRKRAAKPKAEAKEPVAESAPAEPKPKREPRPEPKAAEKPKEDPLLASMVASVPSSAEEAAQKLAATAKPPRKRTTTKKADATKEESAPRKEVTIAPDLASMMAGGKTAEANKENTDDA